MIIQNGKTIHLQTKNASYVMYLNHEEDLLNFHFGKKIADVDYSQDLALLLESFPVITSHEKHPHLSSIPQEYPAYGRADQRHPAFAYFDAALDDLVVLFPSESRRLTGRSENQNTVRLVRNMELEEFFELVVVDAPILVERCNQSYH